MSDTKTDMPFVDEEVFLAKYANIGLCAMGNGVYSAKPPVFFMPDEEGFVKPLTQVLMTLVDYLSRAVEKDTPAGEALSRLEPRFWDLQLSPFKSLGRYNALYADRVARAMAGNDPELLPVTPLLLAQFRDTGRTAEFEWLDGAQVHDGAVTCVDLYEDFVRRIQRRVREERGIGEAVDICDAVPLGAADQALLDSVKRILGIADKLGRLWSNLGVYNYVRCELSAQEVEEYASVVRTITQELSYVFEGGGHLATFHHYGVCAARAASVDLLKYAVQLGSAQSDTCDQLDTAKQSARMKLSSCILANLAALDSAHELLEDLYSAVNETAARVWSGVDDNSLAVWGAYKRFCVCLQNAKASMILKQLVLPCLPFMSLVKTRQTNVRWLKREVVTALPTKCKSAKPEALRKCGVFDAELKADRNAIATEVMGVLKGSRRLSSRIPVMELPYLPQYAVKFNEVSWPLPADLTPHACWIFQYVQSQAGRSLPPAEPPSETASDAFLSCFTGVQLPGWLTELGEKHGCNAVQTQRLVTDVVEAVGAAIREAQSESKLKPLSGFTAPMFHTAIWFA